MIAPRDKSTPARYTPSLMQIGHNRYHPLEPNDRNRWQSSRNEISPVSSGHRADMGREDKRRVLSLVIDHRSLDISEVEEFSSPNDQ
jgi:hypothetical protein